MSVCVYVYVRGYVWERMRERKDSSKIYRTSILIEVSILSVISHVESTDSLLGQKRFISMSSYISQATPYPTPYMYTCLGLRELLYISRVSQITEAEKSEIKLIFCILNLYPFMVIETCFMAHIICLIAYFHVYL